MYKMRYLDENKSLILKILENQNYGKLSECAENQARLQRNLMYLAAIADSQPQPPNVHAQYSGAPMQPAMQQQQQAMHGQLGMSSGGSSGLDMMHEGSVGGNGALGGGGYLDFDRGICGEGLLAGFKQGSNYC
ncbi:hypothetical protein IFM89_015924 [Coptis chinensis]|uniref:SS18 N-terminal domain-containing protein n=1 Tax=Coptis chinensis TaxID=261450 RepID=A0A835HXU8_9MAGN|nr:hypothetical protein IFM89_015924 [Coptis chinensis]